MLKPFHKITNYDLLDHHCYSRPSTKRGGFTKNLFSSGKCCCIHSDSFKTRPIPSRPRSLSAGRSCSGWVFPQGGGVENATYRGPNLAEEAAMSSLSMELNAFIDCFLLLHSTRLPNDQGMFLRAGASTVAGGRVHWPGGGGFPNPSTLQLGQ